MGKKTISNTFTVNTIYDGDDAVVATCSPDKISIQCNADGSVVSTAGYSVSFGLKVGSIDISQYITNVTRGNLPTGVSISSSPVAYAKTIVVSNTATATGMASGITFTVTGTYEGKTYSSTVNVALIGAKQGSVGERGKVGRFFYYGGTFNTNDNTPFPINDAQAPYFDYIKDGQKRFAVYNPANNPAGGSLKMSQMTPLSQGLPDLNTTGTSWKAMTNDFKYIITEALFSLYAHLGSWIFNSDYMLSEKDANGNPRGQQEYNGMGDSQLTSGFIPSIAFDALNGRASFGGDKTRFQPNGAGWLANKNIQWDANGKSEFSGIIHASLMYSNTIDVDGGTYTIDPENSPANTFMGYGTITLPLAEDYLGLELKFFEPHPTTRGYQPPITLLPQSNEYIAKTYFDVVPLLEIVTQYTVPMGRFVTLKATKLWYNGHEYYCWMVASGDDGGYSGTVQIGNKTMTYLNGMLMDVETV